ncbi:hypothetical protein E5843_06725 [Luteimonas yindakuii]|uniref:hypothetical protein n=1 Tax=Luteimonas yindakuii TaxID=2565782 RepID=UPI0010A37FA6|nr:hypothetical protein [Luteimonas yindakuii]QCO67541.1 hypothetical protein E5843_06725 [Luteimonas yindakuii]
MEQPSSIFEYFYRDAGNFTTTGRLRLSGIDDAADAEIRRCLDWGHQFVAEQVGVPSLCREHWESVGDGPSDLDHAYHEFGGLRPATPEDATLAVWGPVKAMVSRMRSAAGKWDVTLSPNCDL